MNKRIKVVELFAGVGGFRLGLEGLYGKFPSSNYSKLMDSAYEVIWSNQWEPNSKFQHASRIYENHWGKIGHSNQDINSVNINSIPDHDLLVGGFPCQDYSVATTLKNSRGLIGKKGVLWWSIYKILCEKKNKPNYILLENVDRLLISPSGQRGRDFAIILKSLNDLGYAVEWRVINAADYGMPQRRRRIFILAYQKNSKIYKEMNENSCSDWILKKGIFADAFPIVPVEERFLYNDFYLEENIVEISSKFNKKNEDRKFDNSGVMINEKITTLKSTPNYTGKYMNLKQIIQKGKLPKEFYIAENELEKWIYLKDSKKHPRINSDGFEYTYSEGKMNFPDPLNKPSRTIITGEGGSSPSRFKHVIKKSKAYRRLSPIELERLNMFPDDHTKHDGISNSKRAFLMGNALVVGVIEEIGKALKNRI